MTLPYPLSILNLVTRHIASSAVQKSTGSSSAPIPGATCPTTSQPDSLTATAGDNLSSSDTLSAAASARHALTAIADEARDKRISELEAEVQLHGQIALWSALLIFCYFIASLWLK